MAASSEAAGFWQVHQHWAPAKSENSTVKHFCTPPTRYTAVLMDLINQGSTHVWEHVKSLSTPEREPLTEVLPQQLLPAVAAGSGELLSVRAPVVRRPALAAAAAGLEARLAASAPARLRQPAGGGTCGFGGAAFGAGTGTGAVVAAAGGVAAGGAAGAEALPGLPPTAAGSAAAAAGRGFVGGVAVGVGTGAGAGVAAGVGAGVCVGVGAGVCVGVGVGVGDGDAPPTAIQMKQDSRGLPRKMDTEPDKTHDGSIARGMC